MNKNAIRRQYADYCIDSTIHDDKYLRLHKTILHIVWHLPVPQYIILIKLNIISNIISSSNIAAFDYCRDKIH